MSRPLSALVRLSSQALLPMSRAFDRAGAYCADASRVSRFLHGRARFQVRPDDLFISSYPRSGTTWLQQMLVVLSHDGDPGFQHISEVAPWFERNLALGRQTAEDFAALASPRVFKSHLPFAWLPRGARYVYVQRDGRDVAVSYFHLYRSHLGFSGDFDAFFRRFMAGELQYGSWFKHVAGWQALAGREDVCLLRYEAIREDPLATLARLNDFGGFGRSPARLAELAQLCTFEAMKADQDRFDHATEERAMRGMATGQFVRKGESGAYRGFFGPEALADFEARAGQPVRAAHMELNLPAFLH